MLAKLDTDQIIASWAIVVVVVVVVVAAIAIVGGIIKLLRPKNMVITGKLNQLLLILPVASLSILKN